jgi:hypothetical protein
METGPGLAPRASSAAYLPIITKPAAPTPGPSGLRIELFSDTSKKTDSGNFLVDNQGGWHIAYADRLAVADHPRAYYMYCPGPDNVCADAVNWHGVSLLDEVYDVQLRLTPNGKPRLLIATNSQSIALGTDFYYVGCDGDCIANPNAWYGTLIEYQYSTSLAVTYADTLTRHSFALDPQGRPRFVYDDGNHYREPDHYGGFYLWCDVDCGNGANWFEGKFTQSQQYAHDRVDHPALTFTRDGRPRITATLFPIGDFDLHGLYYFECDAGCGSEANWQRVKIAERGSYIVPSWDIALDSQDRPRITFYKGQTLDASGEKLYYLTCDGNCTSAVSWTNSELGFGGGKGHSPDLSIDAQNRPRVAYVDDTLENLEYAWCEGGCTNAGNWRRTIVETNEQFLSKYAPPFGVTCDAALWDFKAPALALSPAGEPRVSYDAGYLARCYWDEPDDNQGPYYHFVEVFHTVRFIAFPQPQ